MGTYFILYFVSLAFTLVFYYKGKNRRSRLYDSLSTFFLLLMGFFFILTLFTKDPIEELLTAIPAFWQFMIASLGGAFTIWKTYLNPLKERVIKVEANVASLKAEVSTGFSSIKEDLNMIKEHLIKKT